MFNRRRMSSDIRQRLGGRAGEVDGCDPFGERWQAVEPSLLPLPPPPPPPPLLPSLLLISPPVQAYTPLPVGTHSIMQ